ncbi:hypothetical protein ACPUYX_20740 [Desulfosporosinus sp. SYSU MS00001]|uniref:hypothetical protein n=1 Tax=Desulfosporosinus sp. SYSU MS00001 TaxID=3416284 RepID=UPI003CEC9BC6
MLTYTMIERNNNIYFVSTQDSMAIVFNKFYVDGIRANEGLYTININDGSQVLVTVGADGQVLDKQTIEPATTTTTTGAVASV